MTSVKFYFLVYLSHSLSKHLLNSRILAISHYRTRTSVYNSELHRLVFLFSGLSLLSNSHSQCVSHQRLTSTKPS